MEAKDTVMSDEQMFRVLEHEANSGLMALLKAQAEISYKAGYDEAAKSSLTLEIGRKAGMKEVVEWVEKHKHMCHRSSVDGHYETVGLDVLDWQAFCKEIET